MAARKTAQTAKKKTTRKAAPKRGATKKSAPQKMNPDTQRKIIAIAMILIGIYTFYAFATATPGILDKIIGKGIMTFLFGNTSLIVSVYTIIIGILLLLDKARYYVETIWLVGCMLISLMTAFSINIDRLMEYEVIGLFGLATYGGYGGIIGTVLSYFIQLLMSKGGLTFVVVLSFIAETILIIRANFENVYKNLKDARFGLGPVADKVGNMVADSKLALKNKSEKVKEVLPEREEDADTAGTLFERSDTCVVDIGTSVLDFAGQIQELEKSGVLDLPIDASEKAAMLQSEEDASNDQMHNTAPEVVVQNTIDESLTPIAEDEMNLGSMAAAIPYVMPSTTLLKKSSAKGGPKREDVLKKAKTIEQTLADFGVRAKIIGVDIGPSITRFELQPDAGVKVNKIVNLADDLSLALATSDIRIEAPIPGKAAVGIEVPNEISDIVGIRDILESPAFQKFKGPLPFALGKTLSGQNIIGDISKMPHMLIAGATGSGKSVCINAIIISLLYHCSPEDLKFIMVDPKMVELNQYNAIPHLMIPVVTDPKKAAYALNWGIKEMTERYQLFKENGVREIDGYNALMTAGGGEKLPRIVIVIDELADLMMTSPKEVENAICRIAQLARACGIHLIIATQRPSVDVITGLIKANIPSRVAFSVASNTDSRTILDMAGAEKLLGKGDMLYFPVGKSKPLRVQCTYVSDEEINAVIDSVKVKSGPTYNESIEEAMATAETEGDSPKDDGDKTDPLFDEAVSIAFTYNQVSTSMLQRKLSVGYARAGRLVDALEKRGIISGPNGSKPRTLLMTEEEYRS